MGPGVKEVRKTMLASRGGADLRLPEDSRRRALQNQPMYTSAPFTPLRKLPEGRVPVGRTACIKTAIKHGNS